MMDWYERGFQVGKNCAIMQAFPRSKIVFPDFETPDEEQEFLTGFEDGLHFIEE